MNMPNQDLKSPNEDKPINTDESDKTTFDVVNNAECIPIKSAEFLSFQSHLISALEDLQLKRISEVENEERIKHLMDGHRQLQEKLDEALQRATKAEDIQEEKLCNIKKQYEAQMKGYQEERNKLALDCKCAEKQVKEIKDEIRDLQLCKYNLEKKLKEQERKLLLQNRNKDAVQSQFRDLENTSAGLAKRVNEQESYLDRLSKCVELYGSMYKKLMYINEHHECELAAYKTKVSSLQEKVLNIKLEQETRDDTKLEDKIRTINKLQQALTNEQESAAELKKELLHIKMEHIKCCQLIQSAHSLVQKQVELNNEQATQLTIATASLEEMEKKYNTLEKELNEKVQELKISKNEFKEAVGEWNSKEEALAARLESLRTEHKDLKETKDGLEELNSKWARKNSELMDQINIMKTRLEKQTSDVEIQTESNTMDLEVQATVGTEDMETQISQDHQEKAIQTVISQRKELKETMMQTDNVGICGNQLNLCETGIQCTLISNQIPSQTWQCDEANGVTVECPLHLPDAFGSQLLISQTPKPAPNDQEISNSQPSEMKDSITNVQLSNSQSFEVEDSCTNVQLLNSQPLEMEDGTKNDEHSPYSRFTASLKSLGHLLVSNTHQPHKNSPGSNTLELPVAPSEIGDSLIQGPEVACSSPKAVKRRPFSLKNIVTKRFDVSCNSSNSTTLNHLQIQESKLIGILQDPSSQRAKRTKKQVHFDPKIENSADCTTTLLSEDKKIL